MPANKSKRFLRLKQVQAMTGLPPSSVYALIQRGEFPRPFPLSIHRVAWLEADVEAWMDAKLAQRDQVAA